MSHRKSPSNAADINAAHSQFWKRDTDEIEQLVTKYPDAYADAVARAIALEPAAPEYAATRLSAEKVRRVIGERA